MNAKEPTSLVPRSRQRLRDHGINIGRLDPGPLNAIADVPGVRVGHTTVISGDGPLVPGKGPVRTGVTAIAVLNGAGEITGRTQVDEYSVIESPILITNTLSVGAVHQACVEWLTACESSLGNGDFVIPVVAETFDGWLNDCAGQHVTREHVFAALDAAKAGPVAEGNVGGGTGMTSSSTAFHSAGSCWIGTRSQTGAMMARLSS